MNAGAGLRELLEPFGAAGVELAEALIEDAHAAAWRSVRIMTADGPVYLVPSTAAAEAIPVVGTLAGINIRTLP